MAPVAEAMDSPAGRPVADQVRLAPAWVSVAWSAKAVMRLLPVLDWGAGALTVTVLVMAQVKLAEPEKPALSVAVMVTG